MGKGERQCQQPSAPVLLVSVFASELGSDQAHHGFGKLNPEVTQGAQPANADHLSAG